MCGIIHVKRQKGILANKAVAKRYQKQKTRGTEGFGFIEIKDGKVVGGKRAEDEKDILKALEESDADEILFHHRTPTSTPNFIEATHPIVVKHKKLKFDYYVVHNGIISNDEDLKKVHQKEKFVYTTSIKKQWITKGNTYSSEIFNDSEAMAIDLAKSIESGEPMKSKGSIAVIALQVDKKTKKAIALYYGHNNGNPLKIENAGDLFGISSESGKDLKVDVLYRYDYSTGDISETKRDIGNYYPNYSAYGYGSNRDDDYGVPNFGYWDEETGVWVDTTPLNRCGINFPDRLENNDEVDDEFEYEWDEMMDDLDDKISEAKRSGDWDEVSKLESEKETMENHFAELKDEARRNDHLKRTKRLGF